jgi:hypothetical protein
MTFFSGRTLSPEAGMFCYGIQRKYNGKYVATLARTVRACAPADFHYCAIPWNIMVTLSAEVHTNTVPTTYFTGLAETLTFSIRTVII